MSRSAGFSMIEALVAMLILSVGLLAISKMVSNSLQFTDSAALTTQSVPLAYELAARIRANSENAEEYEVDMGAEIEAIDCDGTFCDGAQLAQSDLAHWKANLAGILPLGDGSSVVVANSATITVQWNDRGQVRNFALVVAL